ncbi:hypothetical protein DH2020_027144 [Rehmannia glutinosa]|uniref:Uncharacterized protein n=1 Tax=Rehmannia glutinosa TaxID=99300 RepID=A0ABR0VWV3_REHGL
MGMTTTLAEPTPAPRHRGRPRAEREPLIDSTASEHVAEPKPAGPAVGATGAEFARDFLTTLQGIVQQITLQNAPIAP